MLKDSIPGLSGFDPLAQPDRIEILDILRGFALLDRFGKSDAKYHDMAIDNQSNIYACDFRNNTIQKFKKHFK